MTEQESVVLEIGSMKYEVSPDFATQFSETKAKLVEKGVSEEDAASLAWDLLEPYLDKMKRGEKPKELIPDVASLAQPYVDKAMETNDVLQGLVDAYTTALDTYANQLADLGLDVELERGSTKAQGFNILQKSWSEDESIISMVVKIRKGSDIDKAAQEVVTAKRNATSAVHQIVQGVCEHEGIKLDGIPVHASIAQDGTISLVQEEKPTSKRGGGGGGSRSSYAYAYDEENSQHVISRNGTEWVRSSATTEEGLLKDIKTEYVKDHTRFAPVHWKGSDNYEPKSWWPFRDAV